MFPLLLPLLSLHPATAADNDPLFAVTPYGFVVPGFSYIQDDPEALTAQDGFTLAARLGLESRLQVGNTPGAIAARVEVELTPSPLLKDAVLSYRPAPFLRVDAGQFKVPYGLGYLASDTRRLLPSTPLIYTDMTGRDMGVMVTASLPIQKKTWAAAQFGAFNGEGANRIQNVNQRFMYAARGVFTPFGARDRVFEGSDGATYLGIGGGWLYNLIGADDSAEEINQYQAELQFSWNVLSLQGEYLFGEHAFANASVQDYHQMGWYGTIGCFIPAPWVREHIQLVGRYAQSEPDDEVVGDFSGQVAPNSEEITGGLNLYWVAPPRPFHDLKLQFAYSTFRELEGTKFLNDRFTTAATVRF
jgi:hypothetical protein